MNQESIVSKLREDLDILTNEYSVEKIGIFGSYVNNSNNDDSDIDLVVKFKENKEMIINDKKIIFIFSYRSDVCKLFCE